METKNYDGVLGVEAAKAIVSALETLYEGFTNAHDRRCVTKLGRILNAARNELQRMNRATQNGDFNLERKSFRRLSQKAVRFIRTIEAKCEL